MIKAKEQGKGSRMELSNPASKPADPSVVINVSRLVTAYYTRRPDRGIGEKVPSVGVRICDGLKPLGA
jgi:hypothetical protein